MATSWRGWVTGSARAALIYQHAVRERDTMIANALSVSIELERDRARNGRRNWMAKKPRSVSFL
jgi:hypothetical protein